MPVPNGTPIAKPKVIHLTFIQLVRRVTMLTTHRHYAVYTGCIPSDHEPVDVDRIAEFDGWMDQELARLEQSFASFVTGHSAALEWSPTTQLDR